MSSDRLLHVVQRPLKEEIVWTSMAARVFPMRKRNRRRQHTPTPIFTARIVDGEDGWYVVTCDELPGCITQGKTIAEAEHNFAEALSLYLEVLADRARDGKRVRPSRKAPVKLWRFGVTPV